MKRTIPLIALLLLTPVAALCAADRPNILWITAEDMSCELGCYGDSYALTPTIDEFAKQAVRYTAAFADVSVCSPSRSTIITGVHSGPLGTSRLRSFHRIPDDIHGFPSYLREIGYYCTNNAKTDYNNASAKRIIEESWNESSRKAHWRGHKPDQPFFAVFNYLGTHQSRTSVWPYEKFVAEIQSTLSPDEIHDPAKAPLPPFYPKTPIARRTIARYYDCVTSFDHFVAEKLWELKEDGLADDTIVFIYSDHGAGIPGGKGGIFYYGQRVPLLIHFPEKYRHLAPADPGSVCDRPVCFADLSATVLNLLGLKVPDYMHGRPFLGKDAAPPRQWVFGSIDRVDEALETSRWITDGRYHLIRSYRTNIPGEKKTMIGWYDSSSESCSQIRQLKNDGELSAQQLQVWGDSRPPVLLFDCKNDPWNLHNLADKPEQQQRVATMLSAIEAQILSEHDLGFWPEPDLTVDEQDGPAYTLARTTNRYPLKRILATVDLSQQGAASLPELTARLDDANPLVRYWALIGLENLGEAAQGALPKLQAAMKDTSPSVRVQAAWMVARLGDDAQSTAAVNWLADHLMAENTWEASRSAFALRMLGDKARPVRSAMEQAMKARKGKIDLFFTFALTTALEQTADE